MVDIEVIEIKLIDGDGPLKAFATVKAGDWITRSWRIIQRKGEKIWVQEPQLRWRNNNGELRYQSLLSVPAELRQEIEFAILSAWKKGKGNEKGKENQEE